MARPGDDGTIVYEDGAWSVLHCICGAAVGADDPLRRSWTYEDGRPVHIGCATPAQSIADACGTCPDVEPCLRRGRCVKYLDPRAERETLEAMRSRAHDGPVCPVCFRAARHPEPERGEGRDG